MIPAISINELTKYYRRFKALDGVTLEIEEGEFFGLLGPNGAGKTTTINVLTGLANYRSGQVRVFGHDVMRDYRKSRALLGLVPQEFNFDPFLTVEQILNFEGGYFGIPWKEAKRRAEALLAEFELTGKRKEGYKRLSGGMKRRLLIARALMHRPKILILDEPTAGVDLELRYRLWDFLREINRGGTTILLTTHYIEEAEKLCGRIGVIHHGKMIALDPTEALIRKMSGDQIELSLKQTLERVPGALADVPVRLEADGKKIRFEEKDGAVGRVLAALHGAGAQVEHLDVRRPTLEDAFLRLIRKK